MSTSTHLELQLAQLYAHPLLDRDPAHPELSSLRFRAQVRETEELERLGLAEPTVGSALSRIAAELHQPRLLRSDLQTELRETLTKTDKETLRIRTMLKASSNIVSETHQDHIPPRVTPPPLLGPKVKHIVQEDVRKQRRNRSSLRRPSYTQKLWMRVRRKAAYLPG